MTVSTREIAATFDLRAPDYATSDWHKQCADRLVALSSLHAGDRVLDAATGTGFAALAAARFVGGGRILGVDISAGMLQQARDAIAQAGAENIDLLQADATSLPQFPAASFDAITCACGLLYMPATAALREWRRLLRPGGRVAVSLLMAGSPPGARIFRECAAAFGLSLRDPNAPLGSAGRCRQVIEDAGFHIETVLEETILFSDRDVALAWSSNYRSPWHAELRQLSEDEQDILHGTYLEALAREKRERPGALARSGVLYAIGRR